MKARTVLKRTGPVLSLLFIVGIAADFTWSTRTASFYQRYTWFCYDIPPEARSLAFDHLLETDYFRQRMLFDDEIGRTYSASDGSPMTALIGSTCRWVVSDAFDRLPPERKVLAALWLSRMDGSNAIRRLGSEVVELRLAYNVVGWDTVCVPVGMRMEKLIAAMTGISSPGYINMADVYPNLYELVVTDRSYAREIDGWLQTNGLGRLTLNATVRHALDAPDIDEYFRRCNMFFEKNPKYDDKEAHFLPGT